MPGISVSTTCAGSTTTTTSPSTAPRALRSPRTSRRASSAIGWNVLRVGDANDIAAHRARAGGVPPDQGPADADHSRQPYRLWLAAQGRHRRRHMASRWARTRSNSPSATTAGPKTRNSWCLTACMNISMQASARAAPRRAHGGKQLFAAYRAEFPELATEIEQMQRRELPGGMGPQPADLPRRSQRHRRTRCVGPGVERSGPEYPVVSGWFGRPCAVEPDGVEIRGRRRFPGRQRPAAGICISAFASTPWRRS